MIKIVLNNKRRIVIGALLVCVVIVIIVMVILSYHGHTTPSAVVSSSISAAFVAPSSSEEDVDTSISLAPTTVPVPFLKTFPISPTPPAPVYAGCQLDLTFAITGGNLDSVGTMQYDLSSKNLGNTTCTSPSISLYYANDETYSSSNPPATADGYYWQFPDLAPGAEYNITLTADRSVPLAAGAVVDEACLSANNGVDSCSNASANPSSQTASIASTITSPAVAAAPAQALTAFLTPPGKEIGVWIWTPVDQMSAPVQQDYVAEAAANHFNAIYLTIDDYLDATNTAGYSQSLENFITLAHQDGISVDAESGARNWGEVGNTANAGEIMSYVAQFNATHAEKFRGVQYDIEPYLLPQYDSDEGGVLTNYVTLVESLVNQDKTDHLPLTIIVPDFYTSTQQWTPEITINGVTAYTYDQIVRLLNELSASRIIVMAYRNDTSGPNGSVALAAPEVQGADGTNVTVLVAQETGPVTPSYVTFNGLSRSDLFSAADVIDETFASDTSFGGIAVDYLDPFLNLQ
jgi:hypothetical protein